MVWKVVCLCFVGSEGYAGLGECCACGVYVNCGGGQYEGGLFVGKGGVFVCDPCRARAVMAIIRRSAFANRPCVDDSDVFRSIYDKHGRAISGSDGNDGLLSWPDLQIIPCPYSPPASNFPQSTILSTTPIIIPDFLSLRRYLQPDSMHLPFEVGYLWSISLPQR